MNVQILKNNNNFLKVILYSTVFFVGVLVLLPIRFEENDDIVMLLLASGRYTGTLESNLIFIHPIYGAVLNKLYSITYKIEWYTLLFVLFHFISFNIILFNIFSKKTSYFIKYSLIILFSVLELNLLVYLQFTTVTFLIVLSGFMLFDVGNKTKLIGSVTLIFIASLLRFEAVALFFLIVIPYYIYRNYELKSYREFYLLVGLLFSLFVVNYSTKIFVNNDWKEYYEFNQYRRKINDNPLADKTASIYQNICSEEQYALLKDFYIDTKIIDKQALKKMIENVNQKNSIPDYFNNAKNQFINYKYEIILLLILFTLLFNVFKVKINKLKGVVYVFYLFSLMFFITIDATLKNRVFIGMLLAILFLFILIIKTINLNKYTIIFLGSVFLIFSVFYLKRLNEKIVDTNFKRNVLYENQITKLDDFFSNNKNDYVIPFSSELILECVNPFCVSSKFKDYHFLMNGWLTNTPHNKKIIKEIERNKNKLNLFVNCYYKNIDVILYFKKQYQLNGQVICMTKEC